MVCMEALLQFSKETNAPHKVQTVVIIHNYYNLWKGRTHGSHTIDLLSLDTNVAAIKSHKMTPSQDVCTPVQVFIIFQGRTQKPAQRGPYGDLICGFFFMQTAAAEELDEQCFLSAQSMQSLNISEHFQLVKLLGEGTYGKVMLAVHKKRGCSIFYPLLRLSPYVINRIKHSLSFPIIPIRNADGAEVFPSPVHLAHLLPA